MLACRHHRHSPASPHPLPLFLFPPPPRLAAVSDSSSAQGCLLPPGLPEPSSIRFSLPHAAARSRGRSKQPSERKEKSIDR